MLDARVFRMALPEAQLIRLAYLLLHYLYSP